ncbi:MAG: hypothetical protein FJY29_12690 [Betaproteobacteria bacterium]|nr:hypothetical protein [Betaproteobacteria bacterium]
MKRIFSVLLVLFFLQTQSYARANTHGFKNDFNQLAHEIMDGQMKADEIVSKAKNLVSTARSSGVSETELLKTLSEKMSLNMSEEEIASSIADLRSNPSEIKVQQLAKQIEQNQTGDKVFMVLLTFALMSLLMVGIFFLIADPSYPI